MPSFLKSKWQRGALRAAHWASGALLLASAQACGKKSCEETLTCANGSGAAAGEGGDGTTGGFGGSAGKGGTSGTGGTNGATGGTGSNAGGAGGHSGGSSGASGGKGGTSGTAGKGGAGTGARGGSAGDQGTSGDAGDQGTSGDAGDQGSGGKGNAPPTVTSITPADGTTAAEPDATIEIEFSEELDPSTVSTDTIHLLDGDEEVSGSVAYDGTKATFTPTDSLALLAQYTVTVGAVADLDGATLLEAFTSDLTVRDGAWAEAEVAGPEGDECAGVTGDARGNFMVGSTHLSPSEFHGRRYDAKNGWEEPATFECGFCQRDRLVGNDNGDAFVVDLDFAGVGRVRHYRDGTWDDEGLNVCELTGYVPQATLSAAIAPTGEGHVVFEDDGTLRFRDGDDEGNWSVGGDGTLTRRGAGPVLAFGEAGDGFAFMATYDEDADSYSRGVSHFDGSDWGDVEFFEGTLPSPGGAAVGIAGDAMTVGVVSSSWAMASHHSVTGWQMETPLNDGSGTVLLWPVVVLTGKDYVAAWGEREGDSTTPLKIYSARWHNGTWSAAEPRSTGSVSARNAPGLALVADPHGNLTLLWTLETSEAYRGQATYARFNAALGAWSSQKKAFDTTVGGVLELAASGRGTLLASFQGDELHTVFFR